MASQIETSVAQPRLEPRLLSIKAAAAYLSVTVWFMRSLVYAKKIKFLRLGNRLVFDKADLDAFVEEKMAAA